MPEGEITEQLPADVNCTMLSNCSYSLPVSLYSLMADKEFYSFYKYSKVWAIQVEADCCFRFEIVRSVNLTNEFCLYTGMPQHAHHLTSGTSHSQLRYPISLSRLSVYNREASETVIQPPDVRHCVYIYSIIHW